MEFLELRQPIKFLTIKFYLIMTAELKKEVAKHVVRAMPRTGADFDRFSDFMYNFSSEASKGFVFCDIDGTMRNFIKKTIAFIEIKTFGQELKFHQTQLFTILDKALKTGDTSGYEYLGFFTLQFSQSCWDDSAKVMLNGELINETEFINFLKVNF